MTKQSLRVLWLLNDTRLRRFDVGQFHSLGIREIFCPKNFPIDERSHSASIDPTLDATLSIPADELQVLNEQDWYDSPSAEAWRIANRHFDIAIVGFFPRQLHATAKNFRKSIVLRALGRAGNRSYSELLGEELGPSFIAKLRALGRRFWIGGTDKRLAAGEMPLFEKRYCFLPTGLDRALDQGQWRGEEKKVFFVCPEIETSSLSKLAYQSFAASFAGIQYLICGTQPIPARDPNVLGNVSDEIYERKLVELRVMFYQGAVKGQIDYHPFEAVRLGMPVVFMAGSALDEFGGKNLPGRCTSISEARRKIERILADDRKLIDEIRHSQVRLLELVDPANCLADWRSALQSILADAAMESSSEQPANEQPTRIAVILPSGFRGSSLRRAKMLAQAIQLGSKESDRKTQIVVGHIEGPGANSEEDFADLPSSIKLRAYHWRIMDRDQANRAMIYAGLDTRIESPAYLVPDDGIKQFMDCDVWILVSDQLSAPLLPIRPYVMVVDGYPQRYAVSGPSPTISNDMSTRLAQRAERVLVTTESTRQDAIQYAGVPEHRVVKVPQIAPQCPPLKSLTQTETGRPYFLWSTHGDSQNCYEDIFKALCFYYEEHNGQFECRVVGLTKKQFLNGEFPYLLPLREIHSRNPSLKRHLTFIGLVSDRAHSAHVASSSFIWHTDKLDSSALSVIDAAYLGVPSLACDSPAMRELDAQLGLALQWCDTSDPERMASQLKLMETRARSLRSSLPTPDQLASQSAAGLANVYWAAVRECL